LPAQDLSGQGPGGSSGWGAHVDALEQERDQDGDADRDGGADGEDDLQP
jgi:hypothetical protein